MAKNGLAKAGAIASHNVKGLMPLGRARLYQESWEQGKSRRPIKWHCKSELSDRPLGCSPGSRREVEAGRHDRCHGDGQENETDDTDDAAPHSARIVLPSPARVNRNRSADGS